MTRHYQLAGAAVVGVLLLAGCSDGAQVAEASVAPTLASPTASPSPSPSATAVVVAPQRPAEMDDDGPAGAEAAAVYFMKLDAYMQATGDTSEWEAMSHEECDFCAARLEQAKEVASSGYRWVGGDVTVDVVHTFAQDDTTGTWPIDITTTMRAVELIDTAGNTVDELSAGSADQRIEVVLRNGSWIVVGVGDRPEE